MRNLLFAIFCLLFVSACDLRPKILSLPDNVGEFITERYPAMLADPATEPEVYNSAANDYGVYASPDVYGTDSMDDYVLYASGGDYVMPVQVAPADDAPAPVATADDYLYVPEYYGTLTVPVPAASPAPQAPVMTAPRKAEISEITVTPGDTLYSLSRKYATPVNDLAVMNGMTPPFALYANQKIKVPKITEVVTPDQKVIAVAAAPTPASTPSAGASAGAKTNATISSAPRRPLPEKITARSSAKFSWPVRGTTLSAYGAKSNGLFNDGINIGAAAGTAVAAAENGVVAYAGNELKGMGNLVIIQHSDGWMTVYAHMGSMDVRRGRRVSVGQKIGTVGQTGKVDRPQLHFEIRKGTRAYNPPEYLKK